MYQNGGKEGSDTINFSVTGLERDLNFVLLRENSSYITFRMFYMVVLGEFALYGRSTSTGGHQPCKNHRPLSWNQPTGYGPESRRREATVAPLTTDTRRPPLAVGCHALPDNEGFLVNLTLCTIGVSPARIATRTSAADSGTVRKKGNISAENLIFPRPGWAQKLDINAASEPAVVAQLTPGHRLLEGIDPFHSCIRCGERSQPPLFLFVINYHRKHDIHPFRRRVVPCLL